MSPGHRRSNTESAIKRDSVIGETILQAHGSAHYKWTLPKIIIVDHSIPSDSVPVVLLDNLQVVFNHIEAFEESKVVRSPGNKVSFATIASLQFSDHRTETVTNLLVPLTGDDLKIPRSESAPAFVGAQVTKFIKDWEEPKKGTSRRTSTSGAQGRGTNRDSYHEFLYGSSNDLTFVDQEEEAEAEAPDTTSNLPRAATLHDLTFANQVLEGPPTTSNISRATKSLPDLAKPLPALPSRASDLPLTVTTTAPFPPAPFTTVPTTTFPTTTVPITTAQVAAAQVATAQIITEITIIARTTETWSQEPVSERIAGSRTSLNRSFFLFAHGDQQNSLEGTKKVLDELLTDFITETCFEAHRSAQLSGRQKIKLDDIKFACRKNEAYLGKIQETLDKKAEIDSARKLLDQNDDKITKSNVKALEEEPLNDLDDDPDDLKNSSRATSIGTKRREHH